MPRAVLPARIGSLIVRRGPQTFRVLDASGAVRYEVIEDGHEIIVQAVDGSVRERVRTLREAELIIRGFEQGRAYTIVSDTP